MDSLVLKMICEDEVLLESQCLFVGDDILGHVHDVLLKRHEAGDNHFSIFVATIVILKHGLIIQLRLLMNAQLPLLSSLVKLKLLYVVPKQMI